MREFVLSTRGQAESLAVDDLPEFPEVTDCDPFEFIEGLRKGSQSRFLQAVALLENEMADLRGRALRPDLRTIVVRVVREMRAAADQLETATTGEGRKVHEKAAKRRGKRS